MRNWLYQGIRPRWVRLRTWERIFEDGYRAALANVVAGYVDPHNPDAPCSPPYRPTAQAMTPGADSPIAALTCENRGVMELAEFLLERLAEDEAPTWTLGPYECEPGCCAPEGWVGSQCRYCDPAPVYGGTVEAITRIAEEHAEEIHQWSRVLARCAADRLIVEEHHEVVEIPDRPPYRICPTCSYDAGGTGTAVDYPCVTLRLLALPHATHPAYRSEWAL